MLKIDVKKLCEAIGNNTQTPSSRRVETLCSILQHIEVEYVSEADELLSAMTWIARATQYGGNVELIKAVEAVTRSKIKAEAEGRLKPANLKFAS